MRYLDGDGAQVKAFDLRIPAMARGDHYPFVPAYILLEPNDTKGLDRADEEAAEQGWSLEIKWSWLDNRRRLGRSERQRHHDETVIDLAAYRTAITKGPLFIEPDVFTAIRELGRAAEERDRRDEGRRSLKEGHSGALRFRRSSTRYEFGQCWRSGERGWLESSGWGSTNACEGTDGHQTEISRNAHPASRS